MNGPFQVNSVVDSQGRRQNSILTTSAGAPVPIAPDLVTTSLLPRAQWMSLADLALIKERNKPIAPPQKPKAAPFFIPTASDAAMGRKPVFDVDAGEESGDEAGGEAGEVTADNMTPLGPCLDRRSVHSVPYPRDLVARPCQHHGSMKIHDMHRFLSFPPS